MGRARVPGPVTRLLRERSRFVALALLASVALAASGIQSAAAVALRDTLDSNWRGAYDILVTADGNPAELDGLLAPNSLSAGTEALTLDDVAAIRVIDGVEVAAPIGEVLVPGLAMGSVHVSLEMDALPEVDVAPQAFRITLTYTTDDGLGDRVVSKNSYPVIVDGTVPAPSPPPEVGCNLNNFTVDERYPTLFANCSNGNDPGFVTASLGGGSWSSTSETDEVGGVATFSLGSSLVTTTRITLVDPEAEHALLGDAGDFLKPLETLKPGPETHSAPLEAWAASDGSTYASSFIEQQAREAAMLAGYHNTAEFLEMQQLYADNDADFSTYAQAGPEPVYVPLVVAEVGPAPLSVTMSVEGFGATDAVDRTGYGFVVPPAIEAGEPGVPGGSTTADASGLLNPFVASSQVLAWPGTRPSTDQAPSAYNSRGIYYRGTAQGASFEVLDSGKDTTAVRMSPPGYSTPVAPPFISSLPDYFSLSDDGTVVGNESAYTTGDPLPASNMAQVAVPVGGFAVDEIADLQSELGYVPLGAYQAVASTLDGGGTALNPSVSGMGLVSPETVAIASIASAEAWGQDAPVSAVRVRVAGIDGYSPAAQQRVLGVADAISALGYSATIVAGSSPVDVAVQVDGYAFGTADPAAAQTMGELGTVTQQWSQLGAAARAETVISTSSLAILGIALGSAALLLGAVQFASVPRRGAQTAIMRQVGWRRTRVRRWMAAEELPGIAIVVLAGLTGVWLSGLSSVSIVVSAAGVTVIVATSAAAVVVGSRDVPGDRPIGTAVTRATLRRRGRTVSAFGARQARIHALASGTHLAAIVIVAVASAGLAYVYLETGTSAGDSLFARFAIAQSAAPQLVLGVVGIGAGVVLAVLGRRIDLARRGAQWSTMRAMGWTSGELRRAQRVEALTVTVPAVVLATVAVWAGSTALGVAEASALSLVALAAGALASVVVVFVARKAEAP